VEEQLSVVIEGAPIPVKTELPKVDPCAVVILGATGDLTQRKLVPALFRLARSGCIQGDLCVLGVGRSELNDDQFRSTMREGAAASLEMGDFSDGEWKEFASRLHYLAGDLTDSETYRRVASQLERLP